MALGKRRVKSESGADSMAGGGLPTVTATTASRARKSPAVDAKVDETDRALRRLHLLLRSTRLYERHHPHTLESLDHAYESLRGVASRLKGLEIRVERGGLVAPKVSDLPLPDAKGELQALAKELQRVGIHALNFAREFHVGELDTLAQLVKATLLTSEESVKREAATRWPALLAESRVEGISVNTQSERRVDSVLASLIAALVAYGGHSPREGNDRPIQPPEIDDLVAALSLLSRLTPPLESARGLSPE